MGAGGSLDMPRLRCYLSYLAADKSGFVFIICGTAQRNAYRDFDKSAEKKTKHLIPLAPKDQIFNKVLFSDYVDCKAGVEIRVLIGYRKAKIGIDGFLHIRGSLILATIYTGYLQLKLSLSTSIEFEET
jgi:hypothetical protein